MRCARGEGPWSVDSNGCSHDKHTEWVASAMPNNRCYRAGACRWSTTRKNRAVSTDTYGSLQACDGIGSVSHDMLFLLFGPIG